MAKLTKTKVRNAMEDSAGILSTVAKRCDVSRKCLYQYFNKNHELWEELQQEREKLVDTAEEGLKEYVENKEPSMIKFVLSKLGKNRGYIERQEVDNRISGSITNNDFQQAYEELQSEDSGQE